MKKCLGCGAILQDKDEKAQGYVKKLEQDYCQRCFRLSHYNDLTIDMKDAIMREDVLKQLQKLDKLFILVIDVMAMESALSKDISEVLKAKDLILVINKYDTLPKNVNMEKMEKYIEELVIRNLSGSRILDVLVTHKKDQYFNDLFFESVARSGHQSMVFCGNVNAGKSTIINKLIAQETLTISRYPSTTLDFNVMRFNDLELIDSPGLVDYSNMIMHVEQSELKRLMISETIRPLVFQFYEDQSYLIDGIFRIDVKAKDHNGSIIFYINRALDVHRTKTINADSYYQKHVDEFAMKPKNMYVRNMKISQASVEVVVNGLGVIALKGVKEINIHTDKKIDIKTRKSVF